MRTRVKTNFMKWKLSNNVGTADGEIKLVTILRIEVWIVGVYIFAYRLKKKEIQIALE